MTKRARIEVEFERGRFPEVAQRDLSRKYCVHLQILRARVTEQGAWYLLALSGADRRVGAVIRWFQRKGILVRAQPIETLTA